MSVFDLDLTDDERARLGDVADALVPASETMPAATTVGAHTTGLDRLLEVRPDLADPLRLVLRSERALDPEAYLVTLRRTNLAGWSTLLACVLGAYYMRPEVRRLLHYNGQEGRIITSDEFVSWVDEGLLDPVVERGPLS